MSRSARILRWSVGLFFLNATLVVVISSWNRAGANEQPPEKPQVELPAVEPPPDPPSLTKDAAAVANSSLADTSGLKATSATDELPPVISSSQLKPSDKELDPTNNPVLNEILGAIREDKSLEVPHLDFPPLVPNRSQSQQLPTAVGSAFAEESLKREVKRLASIKQVTVAADALLSEAQLLAGLGRQSEAQELMNYAKTLRQLTATLASER